MTSASIDPQLVLAWQTAHSVARAAPPPVHDRGGYRVDTHSDKETKRWVFPEFCEGLSALAHEIAAPRHLLKLCDTEETLRSTLPARWEVQPINYFMIARAAAPNAKPLADGYRLQLQHDGPVARVSVLAPNGDLAASGTAAEAAGVFVYDRIETAADHRRKGLGIAVMTALASARTSPAVPQLLVATADGRHLYATLGWTVLAPLATALIPDPATG
ncbi:GNAT family N-acetyltransferase [Lysobacter silvisoli]|uniref:N-acetyltransferase n=1 Tax=Lysobacter silvisoli TaxID=2293254 RepID=A0A371K2F9_9GAMM|nr:GNAT family N-acetyltransferase [Lysobacter silvisoli]RDZ28052.1 N-acetyltransferase [Lysobacter silvisoli]